MDIILTDSIQTGAVVGGAVNNLMFWNVCEVLFLNVLLSALLGWLCFVVNNKIQKWRSYRRVNKYAAIKWPLVSNYIPIVENHFLKRNFFSIIKNEGAYVIPVPKEKQKTLRNKNFGEVYYSKIDKMYGANLLNFLSSNYGDDINYNGVAYKKDEFIDKVIEETTDLFIKDLMEHKVRFNKYLFGINDVRYDAKNSLCDITVYDSDYFTYKCTVNIYNALKQISAKEKVSMPIEISYGIEIPPLIPFLNSIGVGGFVIINRGKGDELVWAFRGVNCQSGGYWHFTYDETFTKDDNENDSPDLEKCLKRALAEEVGLLPIDQEKSISVSQIGFVNAGIIKTDGKDNRFEFEVCSYVRVCLSEAYTFDDFIRGYRFAKDAELETKSLDFIPINELDDFLKKYRVSPEARALSLRLKYLLQNGIIQSDNEAYRDIIKNRKRIDNPLSC